MHLVAAEVKAAGFDLRYVEQPVDQPRKMLGAPAHHLDGVNPSRGKVRIPLQQLRISEDRIQRGAQLMT